MLTILIAAILAAGAGYWAGSVWGWFWALLIGMLTFMVCQLVGGLLIRRKVNVINQKIENFMRETQENLERKMRNLQRRSAGNPKLAQSMLEKEQNAALRKALEYVDEFAPFYKWNFMLKKQTNTLKMMFHYRLKEFDQVDSCLDNCLYLDPQSVSMALARLHVIDPEGKKLEKFFQRRKKRFKGDDGAFIASVYAWIMVKRGNSDSAIKALSDCTKYSDHPSLEENLDKLRNGKLKQFSNSSFGDMWYALLLEEPKMKVMRQERMY